MDRKLLGKFEAQKIASSKKRRVQFRQGMYTLLFLVVFAYTTNAAVSPMVCIPLLAVLMLQSR